MRRIKLFTLIELLRCYRNHCHSGGYNASDFSQAREVAKQAQCVNSYKQMGLAGHSYASDYNGYWVPTCGSVSCIRINKWHIDSSQKAVQIPL